MGLFDDPFGAFIDATTVVMREVGGVIGDGMRALFQATKDGIRHRESGKTYRKRLSESEENERIAGCKKVVLDFATALGYIAREAMSKQELESLIFEAGITLTMSH